MLGFKLSAQRPPEARRVNDDVVMRFDHIYEVDPTIATYLIVSGVAEPCGDGSPALVVRTDEVMVSVFASRRAIADVAD